MLGNRIIIPFFFKHWRVLINSCSSLSGLRSLYFLVNSLEVQVLQVRPWAMLH